MLTVNGCAMSYDSTRDAAGHAMMLSTECAACTSGSGGLGPHFLASKYREFTTKFTQYQMRHIDRWTIMPAAMHELWRSPSVSFESEVSFRSSASACVLGMKLWMKTPQVSPFVPFWTRQQ